MFKRIIASVGTGLRSATRAVGSWIGSAAERVTDAVSGIGSGVAGAASRIGSGLAGAWRGALDAWAASGAGDAGDRGDDDADARKERWQGLARAARARRGEPGDDDDADARWLGLWDGDWETDFERAWDGTLPPNVELVDADTAPLTHSGMFFSLAQALDYCSEIPCDVTIWRVGRGEDAQYFVEVLGSDGAR